MLEDRKLEARSSNLEYQSLKLLRDSIFEILASYLLPALPHLLRHIEPDIIRSQIGRIDFVLGCAQMQVNRQSKPLVP